MKSFTPFFQGQSQELPGSEQNQDDKIRGSHHADADDQVQNFQSEPESRKQAFEQVDSSYGQKERGEGFQDQDIQSHGRIYTGSDCPDTKKA